MGHGGTRGPWSVTRRALTADSVELISLVSDLGNLSTVAPAICRLPRLQVSNLQVRHGDQTVARPYPVEK